MRWLVGMFCPPHGIVLDPFCGSGTTGCAAAYERVGFIGVELSEEYAAIAKARILHHKSVAGTITEDEAKESKQKAVQLGLFT